jgi:hypothetical protein
MGLPQDTVCPVMDFYVSAVTYFNFTTRVSSISNNIFELNLCMR